MWLQPSPVSDNEPGIPDICLIVEGCYPYVPGGVSSWLDWLMRTRPDLSFSVIAILADKQNRQRRYDFPGNMIGFHELFLHDFGQSGPSRPHASHVSASLVQHLISLFEEGGIDDFTRINNIINDPAQPITLSELLNAPLAWDVLQEMYQKTMPHASFHHYFWAWRALFGGMFAAMKYPLPKAKVYHTISTGYAGLLAARARVETGRPVMLTEHGIYTNERQIEILMADWIADMVDKGLSIHDHRYDLRDLWINAFKSFARTCYQACDKITTLYEDNQRLQKALGADPEKLEVIANGIDVDRFSVLRRAGRDDPPTIALIGRVVPIKDIKTFINAASLVRSRLSGLKVLILGPDDEDREYAAECRDLVAELGMEDCLEFTGGVNIADYLPQIHIVVLTSLSEAQPLVILEAGAAEIPCITTDVGSCREIIEGRSDEEPEIGHGGIVTDLVDPDQISQAIIELLADEDRRRRYGKNLFRRVGTYYRTDMASNAYNILYRQLISVV